MSSSASLSFATYNVLHPYYAIKWRDAEGMNELGISASREDTSASCACEETSYAWKLYSNWDERCPQQHLLLSLESRLSQ